MIKKIAILAIVIMMFIGGNLFAQSIDVVVHNVTIGGGVVKLYKQETFDSPLYLCDTEPATNTTVTFDNVPCTEASPIWALQAEQGSRSVYKQDTYSPFNTYHLYLPAGFGSEPYPDPGEPEPPNE